jgi:hypothetical protein
VRLATFDLRLLDIIKQRAQQPATEHHHSNSLHSCPTTIQFNNVNNDGTFPNIPGSNPLFSPYNIHISNSITVLYTSSAPQGYTSVPTMADIFPPSLFIHQSDLHSVENTQSPPPHLHPLPLTAKIPRGVIRLS